MGGAMKQLETRLEGDLVSPVLLLADDKTQGEGKENN